MRGLPVADWLQENHNLLIADKYEQISQSGVAQFNLQPLENLKGKLE